MKKWILPLLALLFILSCNQETPNGNDQEQSPDLMVDSLTMELNELLQLGHFRGFAVAIANEDEVLYQKGFGFADVHTQSPYTEQTVQNIASISKTFIGLALLKAQEMGKLQLDDPINKYLPYSVVNPHFPDDPITIRHLTTHTSSIVDTEVYDRESYVMSAQQHDSTDRNQSVPENFKSADEHLPMTTFLQNVLDKNGEWYSPEGFLEKRPGEFFDYTNVGATLAAAVLEYATGEDFAAFTTQHILQPLGMTSSGWSFGAIDFAQHTTLYADSINKLPFYSLITYPDGGMLTSSADFGKYLRELIRGYAGKGTILSEDSYRTFYTRQMNDSQFEERDADFAYNDEYDFGVFIGFSAQGYAGHTGGDPGVSSLMFFDEEKKVGRFLMINTDIVNEEGMQQFIAIWEKLGEYQERL